MTLTIDRVDAFHVGVLIALYERAVGYYASLIHINAYHQPGVEAGKKAAAELIALQHRVATVLDDNPNMRFTAAEVAAAIGAATEVEAVFHVLRNLAVSRSLIEEECINDDPASWLYRKRSTTD